MALELIEFFTDKLIMDREEDNIQICTNPNEQSQNGGDADTQRRPYTFEDAVNCLIETSHETQIQIRDIKESFQEMTSQLISVLKYQSDTKKINQ